MPWSVVVLDEAHKVKSQNGAQHLAVKALNAKAHILLSGTLAANKWHDFSGLLNFCQRLPIKNHAEFINAFSQDANRYSPSLPAMRCLQRLLQALTIARPSSTLRLPHLVKWSKTFYLTAVERKATAAYMTEYAQKIVQLQRKANGAEIEDVEGSHQISLLLAKAYAWSHHPLLATKMEEKLPMHVLQFDETDTLDDREQDIRARAQAAVDEVGERQAWLQMLQAEPTDNIMHSGRVNAFMNVLEWLHMALPDKKILVFSNTLCFLDILEQAVLRQLEDVEPLRFDGTMTKSEKQEVQSQFERSDAWHPLFLTAGAGK